MKGICLKMPIAHNALQKAYLVSENFRLRPKSWVVVG